MKRWRTNNQAKAQLTNLRGHASSRGIPFKLSLDHFMEVIKGTDFLDNSDSTIDRIDAEMGYEDGNIQIMSRAENTRKFNVYDRLVREGVLKGVTYEQWLDSQEPEPRQQEEDNEHPF